MTFLTVLVAGWITGFLLPTSLVWLALVGSQPGSRWELDIVYGGLLLAPIHAVFVKLLLPVMAHGRVSYLSALVACAVGGLISTGFFVLYVSSATSAVNLGGSYLPLVFGTTTVLGLAATIGVTGMLVWGSATATTTSPPIANGGTPWD